MPAPILRKAFWTLATLLVVAVVAFVSLPIVASTQIVRTRIAQELSDWSGYEVELRAAPDVEVWPTFRAVLHDVNFIPKEGGRPVLEADQATLELSAFAAIAGRVDFTRIDLLRPMLRVSRRSDGLSLPQLPIGGEVRQLIRVVENQAGDPDERGAVGVINISGGRIVDDSGEAPVEIVSSVAGTIDWQAADRPASINGNGIWRGETVSLALFIEAPPAMLSGNASPLNLSIQAEPLTVTYKGKLRIAEPATIEGDLTVASPSLRRALEWTKASLTPAVAAGEFSAKGRIEGSGGRAKLSQATVSLGGNAGSGALELSATNGVPTVAGTLAFETLDIGMLIGAFTSRPGAGASQPAVFDLDFTDRLNLDLRLSAARATGGPIELTEVAASAQVRPGLAAFDMSDANAFGGLVQASLRMDRKPEGNTGELRFSATDIDWAAFAATAGWKTAAPAGRGALTIAMKGPATDWSSLSRNASGTFSATLGAGKINGIDLQALVQHRPGSGFFPLSDVASGSIDVEGVEVKAVLNAGTARIEKAVARTANRTITLAGIVPYFERSLAMSGAIEPREETDEAAGEASYFFVGGSWNSPFVSPSLPAWPGE